MRFERDRAALLAIDLQRAFCARDGSIAAQGRDISEIEAAAARALELVRVAQAAGVPVIWTAMHYAADYADGGLLMHELRPNLARIGALRRGTADVELIEGAAPHARDIVLGKQRFSAFVGTHLEQVLSARGIDCLMVCGVTTSMCVESSVRDAGQRDLRTFVVAQACGDFDPARHAASLSAMAFGYARVIALDRAVAALQSERSEFAVDPS